MISHEILINLLIHQRACTIRTTLNILRFLRIIATALQWKSRFSCARFLPAIGFPQNCITQWEKELTQARRHTCIIKITTILCCPSS